MRGFASEALIICGSFSFQHSATLSLCLIVLGCLSALIRYTSEIGKASNKEKFYEVASNLVQKIVETPNPIEVANAAIFSKEIH
jgi:hypothetical protein|tara:strand:+ start:12386 stop:12637 length:252 start_codon:yes stop_codon:yes gene_type:complete